jgi:hypothetical protein
VAIVPRLERAGGRAGEEPAAKGTGVLVKHRELIGMTCAQSTSRATTLVRGVLTSGVLRDVDARYVKKIAQFSCVV